MGWTGRAPAPNGSFEYDLPNGSARWAPNIALTFPLRADEVIE